jgi:hypothetical protein
MASSCRLVAAISELESAAEFQWDDRCNQDLSPTGAKHESDAEGGARHFAATA